MDLYARVNILEGKAVRLPRGNVMDEVIFLEAKGLYGFFTIFIFH